MNCLLLSQGTMLSPINNSLVISNLMILATDGVLTNVRINAEQTRSSIGSIYGIACRMS